MKVDSGIVLFDVVCNLCNGFVQFVLKRDRHGRFRFASLQSDTARRLLQEDWATETVVLIQGGTAFRKSAAALRIARGLRFPWPFLYGLVVVPRPLRDWIYTWVARHRYGWFGKRESCMVPRPEWKNRFLD